MLKVANIFSNDMVLQRDKNITVWGLGDEERTVTVTLNGVSPDAGLRRQVDSRPPSNECWRRV